MTEKAEGRANSGVKVFQGAMQMLQQLDKLKDGLAGLV